MMESMLSSLANNFPLYFRAPTLMTLTWLLWGVNVYVFKRFKIDYVDLLNFNRATLLEPKEIIMSALSMIGIIVLLCILYAFQWPFQDVLVVPSMYYTITLFLLLAPVDFLHKPGRERFLHNLYRVFAPLSTGVLFVEVVLGDVLTSSAKVLADLEVTGCVMLAHMTSPNRHDHMHSAPAQASGSISSASYLALYSHESGCADSWVRPIVTSIPFLLRFHQCFRQYLVTKEAFPNLLNCLKYFSSLPVIWISAYTHHYPGSYTSELRTAWILCVSFNSFFSFMWDVVMDWGLCRHGAKHFLLREQLTYGCNNPGVVGERCNSLYSPAIYYVAILVDFVLRILWSFKLSVHFQLSQEGLTFVLEVCEVFRRFTWLFFRVEWESIARAQKTERAEKFELENLVTTTSDAGDSSEPVSKKGWNPVIKSKPLRSRTTSDRVASLNLAAQDEVSIQMVGRIPEDAQR